MPEIEVVWTLRAEIGLAQIYSYLDELQPGAGDDFLMEVDHVLELIRDFPHLGRVFETPVRRRILGKGRYGLFYSPEDRGIIVVGILDLRQDPALIRRLLGLR